MCLITSCITCVFNLKKSFNYIKITLFFGGKDMKTLKGSQTEKNLLAAFAGESQAHTKYAYYASVARKEGHTDFAELFEETSRNENEHAKLWFKFLHDDKLPTTEENLIDAATGEQYEHEKMYPEFAKIAREEGFIKIAAKMEMVGEIEKRHEARYRELLSQLKTDKVVIKKDALVVLKCQVCGHVHVGEVAPSVCPVCEHKSSFLPEYLSYDYQPKK